MWKWAHVKTCLEIGSTHQVLLQPEALIIYSLLMAKTVSKRARGGVAGTLDLKYDPPTKSLRAFIYMRPDHKDRHLTILTDPDKHHASRETNVTRCHGGPVTFGIGMLGMAVRWLLGSLPLDAGTIG
eukprot:6467284-Amphidinium_carterae.1